MHSLEIMLLKWEPFTRHIFWLHSYIQHCLLQIAIGLNPDTNVLRVLSNFLKQYKDDEFGSKTIVIIEAYLRDPYLLR